MAIIFPISLPGSPGPAQVEWDAQTVAGRNVSPYSLTGESFEWPGNLLRCSVRYPRMTRAQADAVIAALVSLYGAGTFLLGPAGPGKTPKGTPGGSPFINSAGQSGKSLRIAGLTGTLKAGDYFQIGGENRLLWSQAFDNIIWILNTVTRPAADTIVAPDGTSTAEALTATAVGSYVYQVCPIVTNGQIYTFSIWLKVPAGTKTIDISFQAGNGFAYITTCALTTAWQRFSVSGQVQGSPPSGPLVPYVMIGQTGTSWDSGTIHAWGAQLELDIPSPLLDYFPTTSMAQASTRRLHMNMSDQSGNPCTLDIWPRLRESPIALFFTGYLVFTNPRGLFRLAQPHQKWDIDQAYLHGLTFEAEEAI
jgi:hypothetical protein